MTEAEIGARRASRTRRGGGVRRGRGRRARPGSIVVRDGRVVHHELDDAARGQGRRRLRARDVRGRGRRPLARAVLRRVARTRSPCCTTRSSPAARSSGCRRAWSSRSRSSSCTGPRATGWRRSRTRWSWPRSRARSRSSTASARPDVDHLVDGVVELIVGDNAHVKYLSVQEHGPRTWSIVLQRAHVGRDASLRSSAVALGGDYARLRSESLLTGEGAESDLLAVYFGDQEQMLDFRTLQDHARAAHPQRPAVQGRGRGRGPLGLQRAHPAAARGAEVERVPDQPQPRAERGRGRRVDPEPRDRGERRPLLARVDRRPDRRRPALLPREPRASGPRTPSGSSCSGSSRTCSPRLPIPSLGRRAAPLGAREGRAPPWATERARVLGRATCRAPSAQPLRRRRPPALRRAPRATTGT